MWAAVASSLRSVCTWNLAGSSPRHSAIWERPGRGRVNGVASDRFRTVGGRAALVQGQLGTCAESIPSIGSHSRQIGGCSCGAVTVGRRQMTGGWPVAAQSSLARAPAARDTTACRFAGGLPPSAPFSGDTLCVDREGAKPGVRQSQGTGVGESRVRSGANKNRWSSSWSTSSPSRARRAKEEEKEERRGGGGGERRLDSRGHRSATPALPVSTQITYSTTVPAPVGVPCSIIAFATCTCGWFFASG